MKTITVEVDLYDYDELSLEAKARAVDDHWAFLSRVEDIGGSDHEMVIDNIISNEYRFYVDGSLAHCMATMDKENKCVKEVFIFKGRFYRIDG